MRILVVSQWFPPEPGGGPARFQEMGRAWARAGHEVHILAGIPNWPTGVVAPGYEGRRYVREEMDGMQVHRTWVYPTPNEGRWKRIGNHVSFLASAPVVAAARRIPADVVVATSPPLFAAMAGLSIARAKRVPFVFDVRDLWPDAIFALGQMQQPGVRGLLRWLERRLYRAADTVVAVSPGFIEPIRGRGGRRVEVIPNGADLEFFHPDQVTARPLRDEMGWVNHFVVLYAGTLGMAHGLMQVVDAAAATEAKDILFALVGDGADRERLERAVRERGLRNVQVLPLQPRERMPDLYRAADACLVSLRPIPLFDRFIPSKIFEIMACARPILAAVGGTPLDLVREAGAGLPVEQGSAHSLLGAVKQLRALTPAARSEMGLRGRHWAEGHVDRVALATRYGALLDSLVHGTG